MEWWGSNINVLVVVFGHVRPCVCARWVCGQGMKKEGGMLLRASGSRATTRFEKSGGAYAFVLAAPCFPRQRRASSTAHLRSTDSIKSSHHTPHTHTYKHRHESKQRQQAMEGGQGQEQSPQPRRTVSQRACDTLIARLEEPKEQEGNQDLVPDKGVEGLVDYDTLNALVDNNDLPQGAAVRVTRTTPSL